MSSELRWILLLIGVLFIAGLAWWERRRPRQASASSASERPAPRDLVGESGARTAREPLTLPEMRAREPLVPHELTVVNLPETPRVPVLEPRAAPAELPAAEAADASDAEEGDLSPAPAREPNVAAERAPEEALPAAAPPAATAHAFDYGPKVEPASAAPAAAAPLPPAQPPVRETLPELPAAAPPLVEWPPDEQRRIVSLRLVAPQPQRFAGRSLRQALAAEGFVLGRFAIFHKPDEERRAVLSAASLNRPGTFDADTMDSQHYGGLSLFAVLPGPKPPPQAFDELVFTARSLNERLHGVLQDEQGGPLTPSRIASLRERLNAGATW
jgi:cell division protein ZipA